MSAASEASRSAVAAAYAYALLTAAVMGHFLLGVPIQVSDSFGNILALRTGWSEFLARAFTSEGFLRPFLWAELKAVYDVSQGDYTPWYRGVHVAQVVALVLLFVGVLRPRTWRDLAVVPLGVAVLLGIHTFEGTVVEAFPVNTYMTILICCLAAANLSFAQPRWWVDVAAAALFVVAALTVESGLLVWVIFVGAALVGARGVSRPGLAVVTLLFGGYFGLRFGLLNTGAPSLMERSSGFGFQVLDPPDLVARFGDAPWVFYAYNVATSLLSVLFYEPRAGVFRVAQGIAVGTVSPAQILSVLGSTLGTAIIGFFIWRRRDAWINRRFDRADQVVALFLMVLLANAVISYPYTKDVIMSPAGVFYAAALFVAVRWMLFERAGREGALTTAAVAVSLAVLGGAWAIREVGAHLNIRVAGFKTRNDWAYEEDRMASRAIVLDADAQRLFQQLKHDAIMARTPPPGLWLRELRIFDIN